MTQDELKRILSYDPDTGEFHWLIKTKNGQQNVLDVAGTMRDGAYVRICICNKYYPAHRLAWLYMTGAMPTHYIDHINMDKSDNRWVNLREADPAENQWNMQTKKSNKSGVSGVRFSPREGKWKTECKVRGKRYHLGTFAEFEDAVTAMNNFRSLHHGQFAAIAEVKP